MWYDIHVFQEKLDALKIFLSELAAREEEIITFGFGRITKWESYVKARPIIESFEFDLLEIENQSRYLDKTVFEHLVKLREESKVIEQLTSISVNLDILTNKKPILFWSNGTGHFNKRQYLSVIEVSLWVKYVRTKHIPISLKMKRLPLFGNRDIQCLRQQKHWA